MSFRPTDLLLGFICCALLSLTGGKGVTLALEEKYDQVRQLIAMGKERGYLLYDEVNDILPPEVHSSEEIDDLLSTFERNGIDVYEDLASAKAALAAADSPEPTEIKESEVDRHRKMATSI